MTEEQATQDGWERTSELRYLASPVPGERPTLKQKWVKWVHGYGTDWQDEQWLDVPVVEEI